MVVAAAITLDVRGGIIAGTILAPLLLLLLLLIVTTTTTTTTMAIFVDSDVVE